MCCVHIDNERCLFNTLLHIKMLKIDTWNGKNIVKFTITPPNDGCLVYNVHISYDYLFIISIEYKNVKN